MITAYRVQPSKSVFHRASKNKPSLVIIMEAVIERDIRKQITEKRIQVQKKNS